MKFLCIGFLVIFALFPHSGYAQEATSSPPQPTKISEDKETSSVPPDELSLLQKTLPLEIDSASYYELLEWVKMEGLEEAGDRPTLQNRLYDFYKVKPPVSKDLTVQDKKVTIHSAGAAEYFSIEQKDEDYIILSGAVKLVLEDQKEQTTHTITAQRIVFNQTLNSLTAQGNVVYTMAKSNSKETFRGKSLSFNLNDWNGMFFEGISQRDRKVGNVNLPFFFKGETIERSGEDVVILEDGVITSSDPENPMYRIQARKIWILAPGEWGWQDATLYIGRVPVFYIPFYFQPGDEMFFNPVLGLPSATEPRGAFLQTTTYIYGRKTKESSPLSFLQITEGEDPNVEQEIRGLYLVRKMSTTPTLTPVPLSSTASPLTNPVKGDANKDWVLKIMADLYMNLGLYGGVEVNLPRWLGFNTFRFSGGIGLSRNLYYQGGIYTPFGPEPIDSSKNPFQQDKWNRSWLWGIEIPFRYAFDLDLSYTPFTLKFEYYSDPFMLKDFRDRGENFSMLSFIGFGGDTKTSTQAEKSFMNWRLSSNFTPQISALNPWIKSLSISSIELLLDFTTKDNSLVSDIKDRTYVNARPPDPTSKFFHPSRFVTPNLKMNLSGEVFSFGTPPSTRVVTTSSSQTPSLQVLLPPWSESEAASKTPSPDSIVSNGQENTEIAPPEGPSLLLPEPIINENIVSAQNSSNSLSLTYSIIPSASVESQFFSENWTSPQDITYQVKNTLSKVSSEGNFTLTGRLLGDLLGLTNTTTFRWGYWFNSSWIDTIPETELDAFRTEDARNSVYRTENSISFNLKPFRWWEPLSQSTAGYSLRARLYESRFVSYDAVNNNPAYTSYVPEWSRDAIQLHQWNASLVFQPFRAPGPSLLLSTSTTGILEPRIPEQSLTYSAEAQWEWTRLTLASGLKYKTDWIPDPINMSLVLTPIADLSLTTSVAIDASKWEPTTNSWELRWGTLYSRFNLGKGIPYFFNSDLSVRNWQAGLPDGSWTPGQELFIFQNLAAGYNLQLVNLRFWKNRILLEGSANTNLLMNLQQYTSSSLDFSLNMTIKIMDFLDLTIRQVSTNNAIYRYIPGLTENLGVGAETLNLFEDLFKSFNFLNEKDRRDSFFNLRSLNIDLTHYMGDWTLTFNYSGSPIRNSKVIPNRFDWSNEFSFIIQWLPIPEIRSDVNVDRDSNITIKTDQKS